MKRLLTLTVIVLIILIVLGAARLAGQTSQKESLPPGNWSLAFGPSRTRGKVVDLFAVSSDATKGLTVTEISLENRSSQDVAAVKIGWKLYEKSDPSKILLSGETPQFLGVALSPGEKRIVTFPVVSFAKIHKPLLRDGKVEGNFRIELWVTDVQFDNSNAELGNASYLRRTLWTTGPVKFVKVASRAAPKDDDFGCPNRECRWSNLDNCYRCEQMDGSACAWSNCSSCASGRCSGFAD